MSVAAALCDSDSWPDAGCLCEAVKKPIGSIRRQKSSPTLLMLADLKLGWLDRLHMRHRLWRYRFKSERPSIRYVRERNLQGQTVIDIGANRGVYAYYMSKKVGPDGHLFAFEPQPELGPYLAAIRETYGLHNMTIVNQGLSSSPGTLTMRRPKPGSGRASVHLSAAAGLEELEIPVTTLDDFFGAIEHQPISFIKCDVEDHELEVLRGGEQILSIYMPVLLFECHEKQAKNGQLFSYLTGLGYDGFFFFVRPTDHASLLRNHKGEYVHFSEFADYPYPRPTVTHRNYIFLREGLRPS